MKKQIFGTIMCLLGFVLVSGGTVANGLFAILCLGVGAIMLHTPHTYTKRKQAKQKELINYRKAA